MVGCPIRALQCGNIADVPIGFVNIVTSDGYFLLLQEVSGTTYLLPGGFRRLFRSSAVIVLGIAFLFGDLAAVENRPSPSSTTVAASAGRNVRQLDGQK